MKRHRSNGDFRTFPPSRWRWWWRRRRPAHNALLLLLFLLASLYLLFLSLKLPLFLQIASSSSSSTAPQSFFLHRRLEDSHRLLDPPSLRPLRSRYGRLTSSALLRLTSNSSSFSELERMAAEAWSLGSKAWTDLSIDSNSTLASSSGAGDGKFGPCPLSVSMGAEELGDTAGGERLMFLPCGLTAGSSITVVGRPHGPHIEYVPQIARAGGGDGKVMVSQFMVELQGLKAVDGEDPPRILHLNPRLKGDWSKVPVIEHNTCYRMQWGVAQRCDGVPSKDDEDTVDGFTKCEKWIRDDVTEEKESKTTSWLRRFIGRAKKPAMTWPFPFTEARVFVLTIRAGVEGYHINVGGRHVTSFPYRTGFTLEDATGFSVKGNVDVHSVYATSLPSSHPSFSVERVLEMSDKWKTRPLPGSRIDLFIGILSATNHFAERMAIRKTWMQSEAIKSSRVVARFFVALNTRREVNAMLKKEADYFGDMVILPFMDRYELVVLKTIAICEYGVQNLTTAFIMKCDDDTFVRIDTILKEIYSISGKKSLYMGNLNLLHRPLRNGKWAVTYEEWPEEIYPPYANGPGYIISIDVAQFVVSQHTNHSLRLFKMEDVSMGMWVEEFNGTNPVQYFHNRKFCQYGCMENYFTSHYQSPRQMVCLWDKLARGRAQCCNFR